MRRPPFLPLALAAAALAAQQPAGEAPSAPQGQASAPVQGQAMDQAQVKQRLSAIQARLGQVDQQLAALKKRRKGILVDLQGISLQRDKARAQVDGARLRRDQAQAEAKQLSQAQAKIQLEVLKLRGELRHQVRWMQALGPWGEWGLASSFRDLEAFLVKGRGLAWWRLQERKRLAKVQMLQGDLAQKEKALKETLVRVAEEEAQAAQLQASLRLQEEKLTGFLTTLGQDEQAQKQAQAELAEEALQLERMLQKLLGAAKPDSFQPATAFASLRGDLPSPVEGTLAQGFGEHLHPKFHTKTMQTGLLISAEVGASVLAVADGRVVFADYYQSYGPMVILDHGGGYFTLYTHLQGIQVTKGQVLRQGQLVGTVGETMDGPRLGFEIRQQAKSMDPNGWLKQKYR